MKKIDIIMYVSLGIIILLAVALLIRLIYEIIIEVYHKTLRYDTFLGTAEVCRKKYKVEITTNNNAFGWVMIPQFNCIEKYNVYLKYNGKKYHFDDKDLYDSVNIGDIVCVSVHEGYNTKNKRKHVYLNFEE